MSTIRDVAKRAKVSTATVSRYMNNSGYVGDKSREKIKQAIEDLEYIPNAVARSLTTKSSFLIGLLIPDLSNPYFPELVKGVESELKKAGFSVLLGNVENESDFLKYLNIFEQNNVAGIISSIGYLPNRKLSVPFVEVDRISNEEFVGSVTTNDYQGGQLISKSINNTENTKELLLINGPEEISKSILRTKGIKDGLDSNIKVREITTNSFGLEKTDLILKKIFSNGLADTIIAPNDMYAILILQELIKRNIKVPEEVQLVGYDGIKLLGNLTPKITTIRQPIYQLGIESARMIINIIEKDCNETSICLDVSLQKGETLRDKTDI